MLEPFKNKPVEPPIKPPKQSYKNDDVRKAIKDNTYLDGYADKVPQEIEDNIVLNIDVSPNKNRILDQIYQGNLAVGGGNSTTIITTPTNKDFYISACSMSVTGEIPSAATVVLLSGYINGTKQTFLSIMMGIVGSSTTVQPTTQSISFPFPVKFDRGTVIAIESDDGSTLQAQGIIYGFVVDTNIYDTGFLNKTQ